MSNSAITERQNLNKKHFKEISQQFHNLAKRPLAEFTVEKRKTTYTDARADVSVFDETGKHVIEGREFKDGHTFYWLPVAASAPLVTS